jgi:hypothetical protein
VLALQLAALNVARHDLEPWHAPALLRPWLRARGRPDLALHLRLSLLLAALTFSFRPCFSLRSLRFDSCFSRIGAGCDLGAAANAAPPANNVARRVAVNVMLRFICISSFERGINAPVVCIHCQCLRWTN